MRKGTFIAIIIFVLSVGALYLCKPSFFPAQKSLGSVPTNSAPKPLTSGRPVPAGQKEYYNPKYHMSLLYPDILTVEEFDEGGGAMTVTFENFGESKGFQIFVVPFYEPSISQARFKEDIPSGVRKNMKDVTIDGATGATFYSENKLLGETAEIWFLRDKLLYEVNSFKGLDTWLSGIMETWKFM